jgi:hypothetical protein
MVFIPAKTTDGCIEGDPVQPGAEFRLPPESRPGFPQLNDDFLEQVFPVAGVMAIDMADFMDHAPVRIDLPQEFLFSMVLVLQVGISKAVPI